MKRPVSATNVVIYHPYIYVLFKGGVASAFFWGIVGDVFGRKNTLSLTLLLDAVITLAQSTIYDYRMLLAARTLNGFVIGKVLSVFYCLC